MRVTEQGRLTATLVDLVLRQVEIESAIAAKCGENPEGDVYS